MFRLVAVLLSLLLFAGSAVAAVTDPEQELKEVGVTPKLGTQINLDATFQDEDGNPVTLRSLVLPNRPIVIVPAYYSCPRLCGLLLNGVTTLLSEISLKLGEDFSVVTVSFNPDDTVERAKNNAVGFREKIIGSNAPGQEWHFLIGAKETTAELMSSLGFKFQKDGEEYSHTAAIFVLTPDGVLSQFFAGISFAPNVVRYGLVDASKGAIGSAIDQVFLFCFNYDHIAGKYVWAAFGIMRLGGVVTLAFLAFLIYRLYQAERARRRNEVSSHV
jgi:protein SCO1/2